MRYPLVDGQGNFGSVDGDPPAAMRYTEARLEALAEAMMADLDKDTVDFVPNYDETTEEPTVLPAPFPNLLVNGSTGIAVGMATNIPPHNLRRGDRRRRLDRSRQTLMAPADAPKLTREQKLRELIRLVPGPDFPTGGLIVGRRGHPRGLPDRPRRRSGARAGRDRADEEGRPHVDRRHARSRTRSTRRG